MERSPGVSKYADFCFLIIIKSQVHDSYMDCSIQLLWEPRVAKAVTVFPECIRLPMYFVQREEDKLSILILQ